MTKTKSKVHSKKGQTKKAMDNEATPIIDQNVPVTPAPPTPPKAHKKATVALVVVLVLIVLGIIVGAYYDFHTSNKKVVTTRVSSAAPAVVSITSSGFSPSTISIKAGQAVIWTNTDINAHEVAADPYPLDNGIPGFNSTTVLLKGDSYSFIFSQSGTYHYHDQLNPIKFLGTVIVKQNRS